jgi:RNA polymerase sigma-70 factor (ECF subfamily)
MFNQEEMSMMMSGSETTVAGTIPRRIPVRLPSQKLPRRPHNLCRLTPASAAAPDLTAVIERLKSGDQGALETIFNLYSVKLYNIALRILGEPADTEEIIQDVFWTVYRKAKSFQGNSQFSTWLYRLTVNAALGKIRRRKNNKEVDYEEYLPKFQTDGHHSVRPVVDWSDNLDEQYSKHELQEVLGKALNELKPLDKSVVVLSDLEGLSDKEIAVSLGLSVSAVKTRLHRARLFLRGKLAVHLGYSPA